MFKTVSAAALLLATVVTAKHHHVHQTTDVWPPVKYETTFKSSVDVQSWDGAKLSPFMGGTSADLIVDSGRNKIAAKAKVTVPIFGKVDANIVVDLTKGVALIQIPLIWLC